MGRVVGPGFYQRVYEVVRRIPEGRVCSYGDVATALGTPTVARQVGWALAALREEDVPWHRVINAQGRISGRGEVARAVLQEQLLAAEGVIFGANGRCEFKTLRWRPPIVELD